MTKRNNTYFWYGVPGIIGDIHLPQGHRLVLTIVYTYLHQHIHCTLSNRSLSNYTGYSKRQISRIIRNLIKQGWLYDKMGWCHFQNGTKQRIRIIYGINKKKLRQSTKEVSKRVGAKHVFINSTEHIHHIKYVNKKHMYGYPKNYKKHSAFRNDMIWLLRKLLRRLEK